MLISYTKTHVDFAEDCLPQYVKGMERKTNTGQIWGGVRNDLAVGVLMIYGLPISS